MRPLNETETSRGDSKAWVCEKAGKEVRYSRQKEKGPHSGDGFNEVFAFGESSKTVCVVTSSVIDRGVTAVVSFDVVSHTPAVSSLCYVLNSFHRRSL